MKKALSLLLSLLMLCALSLPAFAAEASTTVYVTVSDATGAIVLAREPVAVTDIDADGALTVNDALYLAHESRYAGGAAAGYAYATGDYGLYITTLWGDMSGSFGYCVNDASAMSLADPVADGDSVNAYIYQDQENWSDAYSFFDQKSLSVKTGEAVSLTLTCTGYDADWNVVSQPVAGAVITVDGQDTAVTTDANGVAQFTLEAAGSHVISARSDSQILVPAVCTAEVASAGLALGWWIAIIAAVVVVAAVVVLVVVARKKKK